MSVIWSICDEPRVALVAIDRPQRRNACDLATWQALGAHFSTLAERNELRALILTGTHGHFCAGDDLRAAAARANQPGYADQHAAVVEACFDELRRVPFPVVAAIEGACVGGGCGLASLCDFRVASMTARIGVPALAQGNAYPVALLARLVHIIGPVAARRWLYGAKLHDAHAAARDHFIDHVVERDTIGAALDLAKTWLDTPPLALRAARLQFDAIADNALDARAGEIVAAMTATRASDAHARSIAAFIARRTDAGSTTGDSGAR
jgi:enoyl-CoA hydratase/carnithine racemase